MSSEFSYEASDEASESELLERSLSVWKGWNSIEWEDFDPTALDIHTACSIGHYDWVRSIILKGEDPALDRRNHGGWTPLMYACYIGHDNIVNLLINAGCDMNMENLRGNTPLMLAASCGNESVARTLVRRGAELELMDTTGWTALFHATYAGHQNFVAFLLEAGANKDAIEPSSGTTPFMEAAAEGHEIIVQLFLQHGVNVNAKTYNGDMARSLAMMNGHVKVVSLIDNQVLPISCLRSDPGLDIYLSSSVESHPRKHHPSIHNLRLKSQGPSIRDGPDAIARMIDRTRNTDTTTYPNLSVPKGYVSFPVSGNDKEQTKMSYRDVTSPINPEDYKDSSGSRATSDLDDFNDDSNAFSKTGAITIKSSSSSSGGLIAALGLSREGSLDSDDSHSYEQTCIPSDDVLEGMKAKVESNRIKGIASNGKLLLTHQNSECECVFSSSPISGKENIKIFPNMDKMQSSHTTSAGNHDSVESSVKQDNRMASPLRDYFPLDSSFPIGTSAPPTLEQEASYGKPWLPQHASPGSHLTLPKDNMTQVEIVNRFLKNLTMNNPETFAGQNRWADETSEQQTLGSHLNGMPLYVHPSENHSTTKTVYDTDASPARRLSSSNTDDPKDVEYRTKDSLLSHEPNQIRTGMFKSDVTEMPSAHLSDNDRESPRFCGSSADAPWQQFLHSNLNHHQKNLLEHSPNQPWTHHRKLNLHHPVHNRHYIHNPHSHLTDGSGGNVRNTPPRMTSTHTSPPHITVVDNPELSAPFINNLHHEYFYNDIETTGHFCQHIFGPTSVTAVQNTAPLVTKTVSQVDYRPELTAGSYQLSHFINPVLDNNIFNNCGNTDSLVSGVMSQISHVDPVNIITLADQNFASPQSVNQTALHLRDSHFTQLPPLPSALSSAAVEQHHHPSQLKSPNIPPQPLAQATVIIPGHVTSQPVSNTIDWDLPGVPESLGPRDLTEMLSQLGLMKYLDKFVEQDVDLQVFLSMTDNDLKELGVRLFGPRKKMTNAIARWHSSAPTGRNCLEQAYADKLEGEMQEMAIQLNKAYENEESLKAQVLQEQQLRSVTEGCLMEDRAGWEQARQIVLSTKTKMGTMGELLSRLRLYHKELRKQLEDVSKQLTEVGASEENRHLSSTSAQFHHTSNENCQIIGESKEEVVKTMGIMGSNFSATGIKLFRKSEKCLKEMQQTLTSLVLGVEHLLKSTHNMDKDRA